MDTVMKLWYVMPVWGLFAITMGYGVYHNVQWNREQREHGVAILQAFLAKSGGEVDVLSVHFPESRNSSADFVVVVESPESKLRKIFNIKMGDKIPIVGERWRVVPSYRHCEPTIDFLERVVHAKPELSLAPR